MDQTERIEDQQLALYTDMLLAGRPAEDVRPPLADAVELLARAITPQPPPEHLRRKIRQKIAAEWPQPRPSLGQRLVELFRSPARQRWTWATVAAMVMVAAAAAVLAPTGSPELVGTPALGMETYLVVVALVLAGVLALGLWIGRKK